MMKNEEEHLAYLLLGSNVGDCEMHLREALQMIAQRVGRVVKVSSLYETEPWGVTNQENYLNAAVIVQTKVLPLQLLSILKAIEKDEGRVNQKKYAPRTLDIDILFYNELILQTDSLNIPHPKLPERKFALVPLNEIAPDLMHPVLKKTISELLKECKDSLEVKLFVSM